MQGSGFNAAEYIREIYLDAPSAGYPIPEGVKAIDAEIQRLRACMDKLREARKAAAC